MPEENYLVLRSALSTLFCVGENRIRQIEINVTLIYFTSLFVNPQRDDLKRQDKRVGTARQRWTRKWLFIQFVCLSIYLFVCLLECRSALPLIEFRNRQVETIGVCQALFPYLIHPGHNLKLLAVFKLKIWIIRISFFFVLRYHTFYNNRFPVALN